MYGAPLLIMLIRGTGRERSKWRANGSFHRCGHSPPTIYTVYFLKYLVHGFMGSCIIDSLSADANRETLVFCQTVLFRNRT